MSKFTIFYIVSAMLVALLFVLSFTFAWYIKSTSKTIGVIFSKPIVVMVDSQISQIRDEVEVNNGDNLLPGSKVNVNLGFRMADETSPAFIRARLIIKFDNIYENGTDPIVWDSSKYISYNLRDVSDTSSYGYTWTKVNFSKSGKADGEWYVLTYQDKISLQAQPGKAYTFIEDGYVELSRSITNDFAEKQIQLYFTVDAIQTENVTDPLGDPLNSVWAEE